MKELELIRDQVALVDDVDYEWCINRGKWSLIKNGYVMHHDWIVGSKHGGTVGKNKSIYLHREIAKRMNLEIEGLHVDHKNLNKLDCQRHNLRCGPEKFNHYNLPVRSDNKSGVRGVCWDKSKHKWSASVTRDGITTFCRFSNLDDAVEFRKVAARKIFEGMSYVDS